MTEASRWQNEEMRQHAALNRDLGPPPAAGERGSVGDGPMHDDGFFRRVLEVLPAAAYVTDAAGRILFYNEAAATLWGRDPELGKTLWCGSLRLWRPDGGALPHEECPLAQSVKLRRAVRGVTVMAERPDGTRVAVVPHPSLLYGPGGTLVGAVNLVLDVADGAAQDAGTGLLASIVENAQDAIVSKDLAGVITSWNPAAEGLYGYAAWEAIGQPARMLVPPERLEEEAATMERIRRGEGVDRHETLRRRKDADLVAVALTLSPLRDRRGKVVGAAEIARDVSGRRHAREQQQLLLHELKHRIKNSLATVQAIAKQTLRGASPEELAAFSSRVQALANAQDLLTGENWNRAWLRDVIVEALRPFEDKHRDRFHIDGPDGVRLDADRSLRLTVVLHELATNAVKYGALSSGSGRVALTWALSDDGESRRALVRWQERGGPPVNPPLQRGFGSILIENALGGESKAQLAFQREGIVCTLEVSCSGTEDGEAAPPREWARPGQL